MDRKLLIKAIFELDLSFLHYKDDVLAAINQELEVMKDEARKSSPGYRQFSPKEIGGGFHVTGVKADFPQWYYRLEFSSREQVYCGFRGKSKWSSRLVSEAINRLENGHCDFHEQVEPNEMFLFDTQIFN